MEIKNARKLADQKRAPLRCLVTFEDSLY